MENFEKFIDFLKNNLLFSDYQTVIIALNRALKQDAAGEKTKIFEAFLKIGEWDCHKKKDGTIVIRAIRCQCQNVIPAYFIIIKNGQAEIKPLE